MRLNVFFFFWLFCFFSVFLAHVYNLAANRPRFFSLFGQVAATVWHLSTCLVFLFSPPLPLHYPPLRTVCVCVISLALFSHLRHHLWHFPSLASANEWGNWVSNRTSLCPIFVVLIIDLEAQVLMKLSVRYRHLRRALDVCLPRLLRGKLIHGPSENCQQFVFFAIFSFPFVCFGLHICLAFWVKQENNLIYMLNGLNTDTHIHM